MSQQHAEQGQSDDLSRAEMQVVGQLILPYREGSGS
jgi:hypothetical protein